jgi:signal transduction histidine kinase
MPRRRPRPLVVDSLLAIVLAVVALGLTESDRPAEQSSGPAAEWSINSPPADIREGDVWNARIAVFAGGEPRSLSGKRTPLLTVQNTRTGWFTTTAARPTATPGFYDARVVFPERGDYVYSVLLDEGLLPLEEHDPPGMPAGLVLLTLLTALPIALRRRAPLPVLAITLAAALAADLAYESFPFPGPLVALYTVGAHVGRPASLLAAAGAAAALPLLLLGDSGLGLWEILGIYAVFGAVWLLGDNLRTRRERAGRLEAEREANVRRAAAEEQALMARELHDIIGHSVSVMTIQAAAAGDAFDHRPAEVREALRAIESTGRETLAELRRLLAGVRPDEADGFAPAPGLESLDALVERVRAAGLAVELSAERRPASLPPSVDLSAYRIVQEALTNTLKHAGATSARVDVREVDGALAIDVVDDGRGARAVTPGHGIIGMQERAALFGGDLSAGPAPGGGFAVRARIPVPEAAP